MRSDQLRGSPTALRVVGVGIVLLGVLVIGVAKVRSPGSGTGDDGDGSHVAASGVEHVAPAGITPKKGGLALEDDTTPDRDKTSHQRAGAVELGQSELNHTFGGGRVKTRVSKLDNRVRGIAVQDDGKVVVTGSVAMNLKTQCFITARYNTDGTMDDSFGAAGIVESDLGNGLSWPYDVKVQPDGKILTAGFADNEKKTRKVAYTRYTADGRPDPTFGQGGAIVGSRGVIHALALEPDGSFIAVGYDTVGVLIVEHRLADGSLDPAFAEGGRAALKMGDTFDRANAVELLEDGRILVAGSTKQADGFEWAVVRYLPDGSLDPTFGEHAGYTTTKLGTSPEEYDEAFGMARQPDGKILLTGNTFINSSNDFGVVRYDADGHVDRSFAKNGIATVDFDNGADRARSASVLRDGRILVSGNAEIGQKQLMAAAVFSSAGVLDPTFGVGGEVAIAMGEGDTYSRAMTVTRDGEAHLGGFTHIENAPTFAIISLATT